MKSNRYLRYLRLSLLAFLTILITYAAYLHISNGGAEAASIHALCPFGGLESLYQVFTAGTFISKIFSGTMILFIITLVIAVFFRRSFCGLICPFGAIQEFLGKAGLFIFRRKIVMPEKIDKPMRYIKYPVLLLTVFYAWKTAGLWMAPYDPWSAYSHLSEGIADVWAESAVGLVILGVTVIGSLVYDRFFCKYLCPMGALYAIIGKLSPFKIERNENLCLDCGKCSKACPMNIDVQHNKKVTSSECINCQICVLNCPKNGALENKMSNKTLRPFLAMLLVLIVFFGSIFAFQTSGNFKLSPEALAPGQTISLEEVKGYMTIEEAAQAVNLSLKEFYAKFSIPENVPPETKMKEIVEVSPGYNFEKIKESLGESYSVTLTAP